MKNNFEEIYLKFNISIFRLAYSYVFNQYDAEDIVQKTFYKLYKNHRILDLTDEEIKKWLFRVSINESKDLLKSSWKKKHSRLDKENFEERQANNLNLIEVLKGIKDEYRIPLFLFYYEGYKISEIAQIVKKSEAIIKVRLSKGKELLRKELED